MEPVLTFLKVRWEIFFLGTTSLKSRPALSKAGSRRRLPPATSLVRVWHLLSVTATPTPKSGTRDYNRLKRLA